MNGMSGCTRIETVLVAYPSTVVLPGARKEHAVLLVSEVPVRISFEEEPALAAEVRAPGLRPRSPYLDSVLNMGWIGEPWRYARHPGTDSLLTDWRPVVQERDDRGAVPAMRSTMGLADIRQAQDNVLDPSVPSRSSGDWFFRTDHTPFACQELMDRVPPRTPVYRETSDFRSVRTPEGVRDTAIAHAGSAARRMLVTGTGRLMVAATPPSWIAGNSTQDGMWTMPWPGRFLEGHGRDAFSVERGGHSHVELPAHRPDLVSAVAAAYGRGLVRHGSLKAPEGGALYRRGGLEYVAAMAAHLSRGLASHSADAIRNTGEPRAEDLVIAQADIRSAMDEIENWSRYASSDPMALPGMLARLGRSMDAFSEITPAAADPGLSTRERRTREEESRHHDRVHLQNYRFEVGRKRREGDALLGVLRLLCDLPLPARIGDLEMPAHDPPWLAAPAPRP